MTRNMPPEGAGHVPTPLVMLKGVYDRAGGPETVLRMIADNLDRERFPPLLALLARPGETVPDVLAALAADLPSRRMNWHGLAGAPLVAVALARLLGGRAGAILHTNDMRADLVGFLATRFRRVPWIAHVHGWLGETHSGRWKMYEDIDRKLIRGADLVLVGSRAMAAEVAGAGARWVEVVTNGIPLADTAPHAAAAARIRRDILGDTAGVVIGILGRLHPGKGHALLIRAFAAQTGNGRNQHLLLVGEGPAEAECRALAQELGVAERVHFSGLVPDIRPWLCAMDMMCVPSLKDSLPLTVLEAMSVACPVIASRAGDLPLAIDDGRTGLLVEVGAVDPLAAAIERLAGDAALRAAIGAAGREKLKADFTPAAMLRQLEGYCDRLREQVGARHGG
jgi:glycosyltransferase involved in cell wall biosynthesis